MLTTKPLLRPARPRLPHWATLQHDQLEKLCPFCAALLKEEQVHGRYRCIHCKQTTEGCCGDSAK